MSSLKPTNGAAFGYLRAVLDHITPASKLPRALGISATLNEVTFVLAPVAASGLGAISPVFAVAALSLIGAAPAVLVPKVDRIRVEDVSHEQAPLFGGALVLWLTCAMGGSAAIDVIEIGAVTLAMKFGYAPAMAVLFTVPLCLASVAGGIWVSIRNRMMSRIVAQQFGTADRLVAQLFAGVGGIGD